MNKNVIVTGGDRGIGAEIVKKFASNGDNVLFTYRSNEAAAKETQKICEEFSGDVSFVRMDFADAASIDGLHAASAEKFKKVDALINNAGITKDGMFVLADPESWKNVIDINFFGPVSIVRNFIRDMISHRDGAIVNVASVGGVIGIKGQTNYTSSKAALMMFTKSLAKEVGKIGIRVNAVAPGYIETDMLEKLDERTRDQFKKNIPMGRFGKAEEVANVVYFLASGEASYITGEVIVIDGGLI